MQGPPAAASPLKRKMPPATGEDEGPHGAAKKAMLEGTAASSAGPAVAASLDEGDASPAGSGAIEWMVIQPAAYADIEIVQEDIAFGWKMPALDIVRAGSPLLSTLLDCARADKVNRILIPKGTFRDAAVSRQFASMAFDGGAAWKAAVLKALSADVLLVMLHAADALALLHLPCFQAMLKGIALPDDHFGWAILPAIDLLALGTRFHRSALVSKGAMALVQPSDAPTLAARRKADLETPADCVLRTCYPYWKPHLVFAQAVQHALIGHRAQCFNKGVSAFTVSTMTATMKTLLTEGDNLTIRVKAAERQALEQEERVEARATLLRTGANHGPVLVEEEEDEKEA